MAGEIRGQVLSAEHPFTGLRPFEYEDREYFFGRTQQSYALYRLTYYGFIAVLGSSGSGKSSLVKAGLFPLLLQPDRSPEQRPTEWSIAMITPGDAPIARLADEVAKLGPQNEDPGARAVRRDRIEFLMRRSSSGLAAALDEMPNLAGRSILIVVDQFEEIFRYAASGPNRKLGDALWRDEAGDFVRLMLDLFKHRNTGHAMITMRSDFIGDCAQFQGLPKAVSDTQFLVPSLSRPERQEAIQGPIDKAGASIDPNLVEQLLNDVGYELDQLPVLQHCLLRMWNRATVRGVARVRIEEQDYIDVGKMGGALSQHADEVFNDLPGLQLVVEQVFRALSERDKEGRATRRAIPFGQLVNETGMPEDDVRKVVDRFRAPDCTFLVPWLVKVPRLADGARVDVVHEALLRGWQRITSTDPARRGWLDVEDEDGRYYRSLLARIVEGGETTLPLDRVNERYAWWTSQPRTEAWTERYGGQRALVEKFFRDSLAALKAKEEADQLAAKLERDRLANEARRARKSFFISAGIAAIALVFLGAALFTLFYAFYQNRILTASEAALRLSEAAKNEAAYHATVETEAAQTNARKWHKSEKRAVANAKKAAANEKLAAANAAAKNAEAIREQQAYREADRDRQAYHDEYLAYYDEYLKERRLLTLAKLEYHRFREGQALSFEQYAPTAQTDFNYEDAVTLLAAASVPDASGLSTKADPSVQFELAHAMALAQVGNAPASSGSKSVATLTLQPNANLAATGNLDGTVDLWNDSSANPRRISSLPDSVTALAWDPTGSTLAVGRSNGLGQLFDVSSARRNPAYMTLNDDKGISGHVGSVTALAFNKDGTLLLTGGDDGKVGLWCARSLGSCKRGLNLFMTSLSGKNVKVTAVAFAAAGVPIAVGNDGSVSIWNASAGTITPLRPPDGRILNRIQVSSDGAHLFADNGAEMVWLYDFSERRMVPLRAWSGHVRDARFDPSGKYLAVAVRGGSYNGAVRVFDSTTGVQSWSCPAVPRTPSPNALALSGQPALMVTSYDDGNVYVRTFDRSCSQKQRRVVGKNGGRYVAISRDGSFMVTAGDDGLVRRWVLPSSYADAGSAGGSVAAEAFDSSKTHFVTVTHDGIWRAWTVHGPRVSVYATGAFKSTSSRGLIAARLSRDGSMLALADRSHVEIQNVHYNAAPVIIGIQKDSKMISDVQFSNGSVIVAQRSAVPTAGDGWWRYNLDGRLLSWGPLAEDDVRSLLTIGRTPYIAAFSPLAHEVDFDDVITGDRVAAWGKAAAMGTTDDGAFVAVGTSQGYVMLAGVKGNRLRGFTVSSASPVTTLSFSKNDEWLATTTEAGQAEIFDLRERYTNPQSAGRLDAPDRVASVDFSPQSPRLILSRTVGGHVELWDRDTPGVALDDELPCPSGVYSAHFLSGSSASSSIGVLCSDGTFKYWNLSANYSLSELAKSLLCNAPDELTALVAEAQRDLSDYKRHACKQP